MESLKLKRLERKLRRQESKKINSKFNFGKDKNGNIVTSTSNPKAHTYNKLMRRINQERDANFDKMLEAFNNGEVSVKTKPKLSKGRKKVLFKQSIKAANDTRAFIKMLAEYISEESEVVLYGGEETKKSLYLCQMK